MDTINSFKIFLYSSIKSEQLDSVVSFVGEDASGSFGIMAEHARFITCLQFGLARFRYSNGKEEFLALPGGVLYFSHNSLTIVARHYFRSNDYLKISDELTQQLMDEEEELGALKETLHSLDEKVMLRLWELEKEMEA